MRFVNVLACAIVAWDCGEMALGIQPQSLFAPANIEVWWFVAILWAIYAVTNLLRPA